MTDEVNQDLDVLRKIKEVAEERVKNDPSEKHIRAFNAAREALAAVEKGRPANEPGYDNRRDAAAALKRQGYKISERTFYNHCRKGLCAMEADGSILEASLKRYIKNHPNLRPNELPHAAVSKKVEHEIKKLEEESRLLEMKRMEKEGSLIDREAFYIEYAGMTEAIYSALRNMIHMTSARRAEQVIKEPERGADVLLHLDLQYLDEIFNDLARLDRFQARFLEVDRRDHAM